MYFTQVGQIGTPVNINITNGRNYIVTYEIWI